MADKKNNEEKIADLAVKNPVKSLVLALLIAISTLSAVVSYLYVNERSMYKEQKIEWAERDSECKAEIKVLNDLIQAQEARHRDEMNKATIQYTEELRRQIEKQEGVNRKNQRVLNKVNKEINQ